VYVSTTDKCCFLSYVVCDRCSSVSGSAGDLEDSVSARHRHFVIEKRLSDARGILDAGVQVMWRALLLLLVLLISVKVLCRLLSMMR